MSYDPTCELCEAAALTDRFYEDDLCWVAECESCWVPMVVWKRHDPNPPGEIRIVLLSRLREVAGSHFDFEPWVDENMRSIPTHYHAHARPRGGFSGHGLRRG
ncbi:MAG: hypothetical protein RL238_1109 [Actinomycetota bacterium]|jgi:hypothetical protein